MHALRNVTAKPPERHHRGVKATWRRALDEPARQPRAPGLEAIAADYRTAHLSEMAVMARDLDALIAHLR